MYEEYGLMDAEMGVNAIQRYKDLMLIVNVLV